MWDLIIFTYVHTYACLCPQTFSSTTHGANFRQLSQLVRTLQLSHPFCHLLEQMSLLLQRLSGQSTSAHSHCKLSTCQTGVANVSCNKATRPLHKLLSLYSVRRKTSDTKQGSNMRWVIISPAIFAAHYNGTLS